MSRQPEAKLKQESKETAANVKRHADAAADEISDLADLTYEELKEQLALVKSDLAELTEATKQAGYAKARQAKARARRTGRRAVSMAEDGYDYATDQIDEALESAETFTKERPAMAMGIAAGAGFLLALALSRR
ncbi:hypothetical protein [Roseinatronobacter sp. S2]|uniref:hypothetical protein n=1 Tax=Roseinatronobacter sp. S2 TaxID=3035471 RepID=UPI00240F4CC8|nr:hypothetical protein [Roseinatronobacter sp. S2]MCC5958758.1 DUF883 family protein [Paracoccaceae bacterium]WFE74311.1 hypothetical protein P8S53_14140 [Roseinatronobacter sp. S2]